MKNELTTIKVTKQTVKNLNIVAGYTGKKQWEITQEASEEALKKISTKIQKATK